MIPPGYDPWEGFFFIEDTMKRIIFLCLTGSIVLAALTGCQGSEEPGPALFSDAELTAIAGTAQASIQQTQQAYTPTPIPPTSTPLVSPITGTSLILRDDQTTLFVDHKAGIQMVVPAGWLPVRINEDEYYKAFTLDVVTANQPITDRLTQIQSHNPDNFRLDAIDIRSDHIVDGIISVISVVFQEDDNRTLEQLRQAERAQKKPFTGFKFLSSKTVKLSNGTIVMMIEESWGGGSSQVYYRRIFFNLPTGALALDFQSNFNFKDTVLPDFDQVVESLTLLNP
jgi:hypothetical protein